jgi:hypothetical protein
MKTKKPLSLLLMFYRSMDLYRWLEETGSPNKHKYPGWKRIGYKPISLCWACEYSIVSEYDDGEVDIDCNKCPLKELWPDGCSGYLTSPYYKWEHSWNLNERKACAKIIADYCEKKYNELKEKENKS